MNRADPQAAASAREAGAVWVLPALALALYYPGRAIAELLESYGDTGPGAVAALFVLIKAIAPLLLILASKRVLFVGDDGAIRVDGALASRAIPVVSLVAIAIFVIVTGADAVGYDGRALRIYNLGVWQSWVYSLVLGLLLPEILRQRLIVLACWSAMAAAALWHFNPLTLALDLSSLDKDRIAVYLVYGDTFAFMTCLSVGLSRRPWAKLVLSVIGLLISFTLYSRTSFFALAGALALLSALARPRLFLASALALVVVGAPVAVGTADVADHRMLSFLSGGDESLQFRSDQIASGLEGIRRNWFFGDYGGQVRDFNDIGSYMHNALSYWRQFGVVFFVLAIVVGVQMVSTWWTAVARRTAPGSWQALQLLVPLVLIESLVARSYNYVFIWFAVGASLRASEAFMAEGTAE